jgi:hypothetical protein
MPWAAYSSQSFGRLAKRCGSTSPIRSRPGPKAWMWCLTTLQSKGNSDIYPDIDGGLAVNKSAQKRAIENYRSRLTKRGIVRFEIQALESDRDLIRALARK